MAANKNVTVQFQAVQPTTGGLSVTILPAAAVSAGAHWNVDGGAVQVSGATVTGFPVGSHTVSFTGLSGWTTPIDQHVTVIAGQTAAATGTYTRIQYTLTTSVVGGHGTLAPYTGPQNANTMITLTATPDSGYQVKAWTGADNDSVTTETNTVTMAANKKIRVEFEPIPTGCFGGTVDQMPFDALTGKNGDAMLLFSMSTAIIFFGKRRHRDLVLP